MDIGYHSRLNALTAALTAQQPPRELPGSSRPVRPRQPLSVLQLPRPQKAPAKPGNCPFAVPAKTHTCPFATPDQANSHHLGQHRTSEQQQPSAQGSTQAWQTPAGQTLAAEAAPTAGVDLAAVEAELDSFADTFAIQPDEALLHAYASLLAEKVAEADDTAEAIAKPEATAKPDAATKAEANEQAEATAEPEAVAKPEVTAKFEADAVTAYQAEALPGILSSASSTTAAPVSFSADSVRNAAPSATSTAVTPALFRKGKNAGVEQSDDTASDENRGMDIHMCQSHKQALDSADGTDVHSQQHCTAKQTVPLQSRLSGQQETAKRWLSRSSQMLQNAHADAQLPGHVNDEDAFRAASKCCNSSFSSSTYAEHSRGDAMAGSTGLWQSSVQTWQDCWMWLGKRSVVWHVLTVICFGVQVMIAAYFGLVHQR